MSASTTLKPGKNELLVNSKNMDLRNSSHQIDIRFADPSVKTLQATLWYMNGRHEDIKIEKPETSDTDGRFAFLMDWNGRHLSVPQQLDAGLDHPRIVPATSLRLKLLQARRQGQGQSVRSRRIASHCEAWSCILSAGTG